MDELRKRLQERVERAGSITEEDYEQRRVTLERTIEEHARAQLIVLLGQIRLQNLHKQE